MALRIFEPSKSFPKEENFHLLIKSEYRQGLFQETYWKLGRKEDTPNRLLLN
jgi:hypothetical protein